MSRWHFVDQKSHMEQPRNETGTPQWETGD